MSNLALLYPTESKLCPHCSTVKLFTEFNNNKATKDGKQRLCRPCDNERLKSNRNRRIDQYKKYEQDYRKARANDLEYRLRNLLNASRARARNKDREHEITLQDLYDLYPIDNKCPVFGFELEWNSAGFRETSPSIDRIDSSKGYTKDNIQIISWKANRLKAYATVEDLEAVIAFMKQGD
jgi:hypothetical protein